MNVEGVVHFASSTNGSNNERYRSNLAVRLTAAQGRLCPNSGGVSVQQKILSLNGHRSQHVVGFKVERAAPERGLEYMTHLLAGVVFADLNQ
jgi:hypothetical protein